MTPTTIVLTEVQCPGVYYFACRGDAYTPPSELVVVERDCPHISAAAKAYGSPLDSHDDLLIYDYSDLAGGREVVLYEAYRYLALHGLPSPDGNTLLAAAAYSADRCPEYFGAIPAPLVTPQGYTTRHIVLANGIFALETDAGARFIAVAGMVWSVELQNTTVQLGMKAENLTDAPIEVQSLFFLEEDGCLALFELLPTHPALRTSARLDKLSLMNAIWKHHPEYALMHNLREQQGLNDIFGLVLNGVGIGCELCGSVENMVALSPEVGTEYVRW